MVFCHPPLLPAGSSHGRSPPSGAKVRRNRRLHHQFVGAGARPHFRHTGPCTITRRGCLTAVRPSRQRTVTGLVHCLELTGVVPPSSRKTLPYGRARPARRPSAHTESARPVSGNPAPVPPRRGSQPLPFHAVAGPRATMSAHKSWRAACVSDPGILLDRAGMGASSIL